MGGLTAGLNPNTSRILENSFSMRASSTVTWTKIKVREAGISGQVQEDFLEEALVTAQPGRSQEQGR